MSQSFTIDTGMILAAGLGKRMLPLTANTPKPLICVAGKPLINYALDALIAAEVPRVIVNAHYHADQIENWASTITHPCITISDERNQLLDTGGGIAKALPILGDKPFYVLNGDGFWVDHGPPSLERLGAAWRDADMDCLLLVTRLDQTTGFDGRGDFTLDNAGRLARLTTASPDAVAYIGGYLVHPRLFEGTPADSFSMNVLWNRAIENGRLHGLMHSGRWFHVGTPDAVALAEAGLRHLKV